MLMMALCAAVAVRVKHADRIGEVLGMSCRAPDEFNLDKVSTKRRIPVGHLASNIHPEANHENR